MQWARENGRILSVAASRSATAPDGVSHMHADKAAKLRRRWEELENPPCHHPKVELESIGNRYLTGKHVCTTCGSIMTLNTGSDSDSPTAHGNEKADAS